MMNRMLLLTLMFTSGFVFFDFKKISYNANYDLKNGQEVNKINELLIDYQFSNDDARFKSFMSYFWQSGHYSYLYFVYEKDGSALFSLPHENPVNSPVDMRTRPWYKTGKVTGKKGVIGPYKGHFPPHDDIFFFYYPLYINNVLVGVGDYDLKVKKMMANTIGLLSIKTLHLGDDDSLKVSFYISPINLVNLIGIFVFSFIFSFGVIRTYGYILFSFKKTKLCSLTGLKRRDSFKVKRLDDRVKGICFLDIDYFKNINDIYGHDIGDKALKAMADCIKENIRDKDVAFRWGGEEFLILIRGKYENKIDVYCILERLRSSVEAMNINGIPKFTISIGYCDYSANTDTKELINQADLAMYESKKTGRNKISKYKTI